MMELGSKTIGNVLVTVSQNRAELQQMWLICYIKQAVAGYFGIGQYVLFLFHW